MTFIVSNFPPSSLSNLKSESKEYSDGMCCHGKVVSKVMLLDFDPSLVYGRKKTPLLHYVEVFIYIENRMLSLPLVY